MTGKHRKTPADVRAVINREIRPYFEIVSLDVTEYEVMLVEAERLNVVGAQIYDAIHVHAARKAEAETILTGNIRHFTILCPVPPPQVIDFSQGVL